MPLANDAVIWIGKTTGVTIESWKIIVDKIISFDFGKLDYASDDISKLKIMIKPSDCILLD